MWIKTRARNSSGSAVSVPAVCYVVALWHNWIWWGQSTRFTVTNSLDGIVYALITGATLGWLWPH